MELKPKLPGKLTDRLLDDCLEFYPMFARWPTYQEVVDWSEVIGGTVSLPTFRAILCRARTILDKQPLEVSTIWFDGNFYTKHKQGTP